MLGHNISVVNLKNLPPRAGVFAVGSIVKVEARMGPGFNHPGGVAKVVSRKSMGHGDGVETVYTVSYTIDRRSESDLPVELLSLHTETVGRRLSSSTSSTAASSSTISSAASSSEARCAMDMRKEFDDKMKEKEKQMEVERWQAREDRREAAGLREKMKGHLKELSLLEASMKAEREERAKLEAVQQACLEELHKDVDEIAAEARAANDGENKMAAQLKAVQSRLRKEEKEKKKAEAAVEETRNIANANQARILANVGRLLDEQKQAVEEEHLETIQEHESMFDELQEKLEASQKPAGSLVEGAEKAGVTTEKRLTGTTGVGASSLGDVGERSLAAVVRATASTIVKTLELASPGGSAEDAARHVFQHKKLRPLIAAAGNSAVNPELHRLSDLHQNLAVAVRICMELKEADNVEHLLSLFPRKGFRAEDIAAACSSPSKPFLPGDLVRVGSTKLNGGALVQYGRVVAVMEKTATVVLLKRATQEKNQRHSTTSQAVSAVAATATGSEEEELELPLLRHAAAVHVTSFQVYKAWKLAASQFPGAHPTPQARWSRISKTLEGAQELAKHLSNEEYFALAEASRKNAMIGLKYLRTMTMRRSYKLLKAQCRLVRVPVIRWQDYLTMVSTREYANLTVLNCVCTLCRILIYEAKEEFLTLVDQVVAPTLKSKALKTRIEQHNRYDID